jgi:hypothetical protein
MAPHFCNQSNSMRPSIVSWCSLDIHLYTAGCGAEKEQKNTRSYRFNRPVIAEKSRQIFRPDSIGFRSLRRQEPKT